jgi:diguanylate cyclase (GGDEF)-like protein
LKSVAKRLKGCLRDDDIVSRQGGDEFTILLSDITHQETTEVAERILHFLSQPFMLEGHECFITPSIGISLYPFDGKNIEDLIKNADRGA